MTAPIDDPGPFVLAVTVMVAITDDGSAVIVCTTCGELGRCAAGAGDVGAMVRGKAAAHASLHSTALRQGIPWELVQAALGR